MKQFKEVLREVESELVKKGEYFDSSYRLHIAIKKAINEKFKNLGYEVICEDYDERSNTFFIRCRKSNAWAYIFKIKTMTKSRGAWESMLRKVKEFTFNEFSNKYEDIEEFIKANEDSYNNMQNVKEKEYTTYLNDMIDFLKKNIVSKDEYEKLTKLLQYGNGLKYVSIEDIENDYILKNMSLIEIKKVSKLFEYSTLGGYHRNGFTYEELVKANNVRYESKEN